MDNRGATTNTNKGGSLLSTTVPGATPPPQRRVMQSLSAQVKHHEFEADHNRCHLTPSIRCGATPPLPLTVLWFVL